MEYLKRGIIALVALGLGVVLGFFLFQKGPEVLSSNIGMRDEGDRFVNPLLDCADLPNISNKTVNDLRDELTAYVDNKKDLDKIAIYFRDLNNGPWFGINQKDDFYPASLLKVPLMIAVYREAMKDPSYLKKEIEVKDDTRNVVEYFKPEHQIVKGNKYTIRELVRYMIEYSDNNASDILSLNVDFNILKETFSDLGLSSPDMPEYTISVKDYSSFFRILYNSTYLNKDYSEESLRTLASSTNRLGLVAGVGPGISVAHKFGERDIGDGKKQFHDCGIVYLPGRPYILCAMTRGDNYDKEVQTIAEISKLVYDRVSKLEN